MKISGTVKNFQNQPLEQANIVPLRNGKSFNIGTVTSEDGSFILQSNEIEPDTNIKITYLGYKPQVKKAKDVQDAKIVMEESFEELDEVVIVAPKKKTVPINKKFNNNAIMLIGGGAVFAMLALVFYKHKTL